MVYPPIARHANPKADQASNVRQRELDEAIGQAVLKPTPWWLELPRKERVGHEFDE